MRQEPIVAGRYRFTFHAVLGAFALVLTSILAELMATGYYLIQDGKYIYPGDRLSAERSAYVEPMRTKECTYGDSVLPHPFLASIQTSGGPCGASYANRKSLIGHEFPDQLHHRVAYILVTGGSVAAQFTWDNRAEESALERILNSEFTSDRYERFVVLNGGHGGWKQPNQYILFGLYADVLAGVITLDGFNEHYSIGLTQRFEVPSNNFFDVVKRLDSHSPLSQAALKLDADLYRFASAHTIFHVSSLAYLVVDKLRGGLRKYASRTVRPSDQRGDDWISATYDRMFLFTDEMTQKEREEWALDQYGKYIRLIHAGASALGIPSLFLIQPIPALEKPLTEQEAIYAGQTSKAIYSRMVNHLLALRIKHRIPVYSLVDTFKETKQEIYRDVVHVNNVGNDLMAERIANLIESEWGWPRHRATKKTP